MPAKTSRRHRQGEESRQRILDAAVEIAAERGYDGTTMALITDRTGLPASSVYWQFRNKDELLAEALDHSYRDWRRVGPTWEPGEYTGDTADRIRRRLGYSNSAVRSQPEYWRLGLMVSLLRRSDKIAAQGRFTSVRGETVALIDDWWRSVLPEPAAHQPDITQALTRGYLTLVDGMFVAHRADQDLDLSRLIGVLGDAIARTAQAWARDPSATAARLNAAAPAAPRRAARRKASGDSRERLLQATAELAAERGYRGTTISRICERAGLPVSSLYWFFQDKDELFAEVVQHSWDEWIAEQPKWELPESGQTRADRLRAILFQAARSLQTAPPFIRIGHMLTLEQQSSEVAARVRFLQIRTGIMAHIEEWFSQTLPADSIAANPDLALVCAQGVVAFTDGYFLGALVEPGDRPIVPFVEFVVDVLEAAANRPIAKG